MTRLAEAGSAQSDERKPNRATAVSNIVGATSRVERIGAEVRPKLATVLVRARTGLLAEILSVVVVMGAAGTAPGVQGLLGFLMSVGGAHPSTSHMDEGPVFSLDSDSFVVMESIATPYRVPGTAARRRIRKVRNRATDEVKRIVKRRRGKPRHTCALCGDHGFAVFESLPITHCSPIWIPCSCSGGELAAQGQHRLKLEITRVFELDDAFHMHHRRTVRSKVLEDERDYSVECEECYRRASSFDEAVDENPAVGDSEFWVHCTSCGHEVQFGWVGEVGASAIRTCESDGFVPEELTPDPKYETQWLQQGWRPWPREAPRADRLIEHALVQPAVEVRLSTAIHEAGHAVVFLHLNVPIRYATIRPNATSRGHVMPSNRVDGRNSILGSLAGYAAQRLLDPYISTFPASPDVRMACLSWWGMGGSSSGTTMEGLRHEAEHLVVLLYAPIMAVAEALMKHETLTGDEIAVIMARSMRPPPAAL